MQLSPTTTRKAFSAVVAFTASLGVSSSTLTVHANDENSGAEREPAADGDGELRATTSPADDPARDGSVDSTFYVRTDSDQTTVITPSVHFRKEFRTKTSVDVVYLADIWTSASVDVRTAASEEVVEQRDEIDLGIDQAFGTTSIGLGYRFSHEVDYVANSVALSVSHEAFQRTSTIAGRIFTGYDQVGRSGDAHFDEDIRTVGLWLGWTQVLTKKTLVQLSYEWRWSRGYQASVYRWVPIGPANTCNGPGAWCLPEVHPTLKIRNAIVLRARQAVTPKISIGAGYRFYWDQWKIRSHTITADAAFNLARNLVVALDYRGYVQNGAFFYKERYLQSDDLQYISRDREMSRLNSHKIGGRFEYLRPFDVARREWSWKFGLMAAGTFYEYPEFRFLDRVAALEISSHLGLGF